MRQLISSLTVWFVPLLVLMMLASGVLITLVQMQNWLLSVLISVLAPIIGVYIIVANKGLRYFRDEETQNWSSIRNVFTILGCFFLEAITLIVILEEKPDKLNATMSFNVFMRWLLDTLGAGLFAFVEFGVAIVLLTAISNLLWKKEGG
jgi:hypothetical protein